MSSTGTLPSGTVVADRYRIEEPLAGEGSAAAYRATDLRLERAVALRALTADGGAAVQQGKAAARLVHPNVARVLDFGSDAALGVEFVVADLGTGGTLSALLAQRGAPPLPLALRIVQEAAAGMAAAHRAGLVHGDLHPGVLWLSRDEGRLHVQVLGLGLNPAGAPPARATARYASPERLRRGRELAPAADVFSLGVVAYEVFAGLPAEWMSVLLSMARGQAVIAPSLLDARPDLPAHVAQAVRRALLADPSQRWPEAGDFAAHLIAESAAAPAPAPAVAAAPQPVAAPITAASFAAHVAEAAAPADQDEAEVPADSADAREPVGAIAAADEPVPAAEPVVVASVDVPAPAAPSVVDAVVVPPAPVAAPPAPRQPARRGKPIVAAKTDLADSLYIPPALEKAARPEPRTPVRAEAPAPTPAPRAEVIAPARRPEPAMAKAEPVIAAPEPAVLEREADRPIVVPTAEVVALVPHRPADVSVAEGSADAAGTALIPIPARSRKSGMAKMGQPTGNRRALLAAGIVAAVLVSGGVIAKTVLAGSGSRPEAQSLAAASLLPTTGGVTQPRQAAVDPVAPGAPADTPAAAVDPTLTPQEQARKAEEQKKLEEQRRQQQRQRDSLRQAQQLAAQQQQSAAPQVALAAPPRPAAAAPAPQIEQRAAVPAASEPPAPPPAAPAPRTADANRVYGGGEVDQAPSLSNGSSFRSAVNRSYPAVLRNSGQWGSAVVSFTVGADGRVERSSITVDQASHPSFRSAAAAAIASARFSPARVNGQPVRASVSMPITWQGGEQRDED
jgi:serine/threonine-protein kinase